MLPQDKDFVYDKKFAEMFIKNEQNLKSETTEARLLWNCGKLETLEQKLNEVIDTRSIENNEVIILVIKSTFLKLFFSVSLALQFIIIY